MKITKSEREFHSAWKHTVLKRTAACLISAGIAFCCVFFGVFSIADKNLGDRLYHNPSNVDGRIKIIKIDDRTMNELGDFSKWDRSVYADLMEKICISEEIRPAVIGFDILFSSDKGDEHDERFAQLCAENGNVVTGFSYVFSTRIVTDENGKSVIDKMYPEEKVMPYEKLKNSTEHGFVNALMNEDDSLIRTAFLYFDENGVRNKSLVSAVYEKYMAHIGQTPVYPTDENTFGFKYSGKPEDFVNVSLIDVLNGDVPAEAFDDSIVLVGAYANGMMDSYFVPVDRGTQMYGVEIHANILQAVIENKTLNEVPVVVNCIIAVVIAVLLMLICEKTGVALTICICVGTALLKLGAGFIMFNAGYTWENLTVPVIAVLTAIYYTVKRYYGAKAAKRSIEKAFSKYVAPQVVSEIAKSGTYELRLGGENRDIAVLFVDIRGFTPLSESLEPEQVVDILNSYLALTTSCIFRHGGTLDKFIGDATMAVFNAPFDTDDYVYKALLAAWDIVQGGNKIEEKFVERYGKHVGFGVGVNCGPAVVGNIGCDFRMDYTAIGDTVNTAARLEANAPRGTVYISNAVYEHVKDRVTVDEVGEIPLKGKSKGVFVYSVTGVKDYTSPVSDEFTNV